MTNFIKSYSKTNPNQFNEEIIYGLREKDNIVDYISDSCKAVETIPHVTYNGYEVIEDESKFKERNWMPIDESRMSLVNFSFTIDYRDEQKEITMPIFIPKLIDKYFYILNGNRYFPIYQIVDESTYNNRDSCILKSLLMPIIIKRENKIIKDTNETAYDSNYFIINLFKHKINILLYYFAYKGMKETIKFFGFEKKIKVGKITKEISEKQLCFPFKKEFGIYVSKAKFKKDKNFRQFVTGMLALFNKRTDIERINEIKYWKMKLGAEYTKNVNLQAEKSDTVLLSFRRILDERTKKILRIDFEDKKDIFHLIRWMTSNFNSLLKKDNLNLVNRRLRMVEYQIANFNKILSDNTYRILNSKNISMNKLAKVFKIPPMVIIKDLLTAELLRYSNNVNDMDLFTTALKYSFRGPSSIGENSKKISIMYRAIHPSHINRIALNSCPASDPGMTGILSPFIETDGYYFE